MKNQVKESRLAKGFTQKKLSEISGVSRASISRIENGIVPNPVIYTCIKLSNALGVPIKTLFEEA